MKFVFWSDTNMVNAVTRLEDRGIAFRPDLLKNVVQVADTDIAAQEILKEEGGEEWFG